MSVSQNIKSAVAKRNIRDIRDYLWSAINFDKSMSGSFRESFDYVLSSGIPPHELFEKDDGAEYSTSATKENFYALGGLLHVNFSERKLEAMKKMGRELWPPKPVDEEETPPDPIDSGIHAHEEEVHEESGFLRTIFGAGGEFLGAIRKAPGALIEEIGKLIKGSSETSGNPCRSHVKKHRRSL